jgi:hypothetical protein
VQFNDLLKQLKFYSSNNIVKSKGKKVFSDYVTNRFSINFDCDVLVFDSFAKAQRKTLLRFTTQIIAMCNDEFPTIFFF